MTDSTPETKSAAFRAYIDEVGRNLAAGNATEHTHRPALQSLVQTLSYDVRAVNEPKRVACGAPDYIVTRHDLPVGYIEAKDVGRSLDEIERSDQLKHYRDSLSNLILTDYLEFRWYRDGEQVATGRLAYVGGASGKLQRDRDGQAKVTAMLEAFLAQSPPIVGTPEDLAKRMAALTRIIRDIVGQALEHDRSGGSPLRDQLEGFRRVLIHDLSEEQFADMYAQTIAYGLFAAWVNAPAGEHFSRQHAAYDLPKTNPFLRQMFGQIAGPELDERITWAVDDLAELLARARMDLVLENFGKRTRQEDPVVHFYETFLKAYDPKMREARGVYYTPEPVVSYIVRSVDHILKTEFGLPDGLADNSMIEVPVPGKPKETRKVHRVQILDPACGTGTFLAQVIEIIHDTVVAKHGAGMWPGYVHNHLLPRLYGFELLMAPYAVAHLKLGLRLKETGYDIEQSERLHVYLTNSLEEAHEHEHGQLTFFGAWLAEEADRASEVKRELPIMVILGNPPYSASSQNKGTWISDQLRDYKQGLNERKINLDDDFIKFFRFGQWRIAQTGYGILGFISNNSFLTGITYRRMRESLLTTFDSISVLDLHGDMRQHDVADDGGTDDNVFDITQGVAITLMVKRPTAESAVFRSAHLAGQRQGKYDFLANHDISATEWAVDPAEPPNFFFARPADSPSDEYLSWPSVTDIFGSYSSGIQTKRDRLCVQFSRDDMREAVRAFGSTPVEAARLRFNLPADGRDWTVASAQADIIEHDFSDEFITQLLYRPFDLRYTYWTGRTKGFLAYPRRQVMQHLIGGQNVALMFNRQIAGASISQFGVTSIPACHGTFYLGNRGQDYVAPLFLEPSRKVASLSDEGAPLPKHSNVAPPILGDFERRLALRLDESGESSATGSFSSRDVLNYIYAILNSAAYRHIYSARLKIDFPRIPLTSDRELFRELCRLGSRLVMLHLMEADDLPPITTYPVPGDNCVEKVRYTEPGQGAEQGRVWINTTQYLAGVSPEVWEFHVGGYQVCAKWLKDRKGRQLTYDDLTHYQYVVAALAETIAIMREIDEVIEAHGGWPIQ